MKLTGQCKIDFYKWLIENKEDLITFQDLSTKIDVDTCAIFKHLTPTMQHGVLEDFFDSVDINIVIYYYKKIKVFDVSINEVLLGEHKKRPQARTQAKEKANEIYNNK